MSVRWGFYFCSSPYVRFPQILFNNKLSPLAEEKILIQIDSYPTVEKIKPEVKIISRADIFCEAIVYPPSVILAQKIFALMNRKRAKGRDIYDIVYLFSLTEPDWKLLKKLTNIADKKQLKIKLLSLFSEHDRDCRQFGNSLK